MEALLLRIKQIDLEEGIIHVEHAKFDKERLIPLSSSMLAILRQYYDIMHPHSSPDDFFFVGITRTPYTHHEVYIRFRELLQQACIPHAGRGNGPRIHDLRHTFCCHTLQQSVANGQDMNAFLPILSEYLGHESLTATSQYLKMTAEVYPDILKSVEGLCSRAIPEVSR
jgi:integrase